MKNLFSATHHQLPFSSMRELVAEQAKRYGENIYLKTIDDAFPQVTYAQLNQFVDHLAQHLNAIDIPTHARIVVLLDNSPLHALLFISLIACDRLYIPVNPKSTTSELAAILDIAKADAIIFPESLAQQLPREQSSVIQHLISISDPVVFFNRVMSESCSTPYQSNAKADDIAEMVFTSGSTGTPKGVLLSHQAILHNSASLARRYQLTQQDHLLTVVPLFHCGGQMFSTLSPLWVGARTSVVNAQVALVRFWDLVNLLDITWTILISAFLPVLVSTTNTGTRRMKGILVGGSAVTADITEAFEEKFQIPTYQVYGMTELAAVCISEPLDRTHRTIGSAGTAIDICDVKIMRTPEEESVYGEQGEIYLTGLNIFSGYYNALDRTRNIMHGHYIKTGDMGYIDKGGNLHILDRVDNMFNVCSENIYPAEIERVCSKLSAIEAVVILPIRNPKIDNDIVMVYKLRPNQTPDFPQWEALLRKELSFYKIPRHRLNITDLSVNDWPLTGSGKISRPAVINLVKEFFARELSPVAEPV
ncbi:MAG TPA: class I adenylate-forming enzyme family protein [Cellvibrio sp.]|nr:class I adenylate-forming enzyme family protein [Cellvibrio sp.]